MTRQLRDSPRFTRLQTRHQQKPLMNTDLANVRRQETVDFCRLKNTASEPWETDNLFMPNKIYRLKSRESQNVMRHTRVVIALRY